MMEKRNVVETRRTPTHELQDSKGDWDKRAADSFTAGPKVKPVASSKRKGSVANVVSE